MGEGNHDILLTPKDTRVASITFAIKERFCTLVDANAIQLDFTALEYYCTFGALMITQMLPLVCRVANFIC